MASIPKSMMSTVPSPSTSGFLETKQLEVLFFESVVHVTPSLNGLMLATKMNLIIPLDLAVNEIENVFMKSNSWLDGVVAVTVACPDNVCMVMLTVRNPQRLE